MIKILLTGSSGFIGKNILKKLGGDYSFFTPDHMELDLLNAHKVQKYLAENNFDVVVHAAGKGVSRLQNTAYDVFKANRSMFLNLAKNADRFGRMIFLGSGAEYGKQRSITKVKESDFGKILPEDEYGKAKFFASEYIASAKNIINLRLFGVFGPYEDYHTRFISNAICRSLSDMPIVLGQNAIFDYLYVKDFRGILEYFIKAQPKEKFYNVGAGEHIELSRLAEMIKRLTRNPFEIIVKTPGLNKEYTANNSRLVSELNNFQFTKMEVAIGEMIDWYKENISVINKNDLNFDA